MHSGGSSLPPLRHHSTPERPGAGGEVLRLRRGACAQSRQLEVHPRRTVGGGPGTGGGRGKPKHDIRHLQNHRHPGQAGPQVLRHIRDHPSGGTCEGPRRRRPPASRERRAHLCKSRTRRVRRPASRCSGPGGGGLRPDSGRRTAERAGGGRGLIEAGGLQLSFLRRIPGDRSKEPKGGLRTLRGGGGDSRPTLGPHPSVPDHADVVSSAGSLREFGRLEWRRLLRGSRRKRRRGAGRGRRRGPSPVDRGR